MYLLTGGCGWWRSGRLGGQGGVGATDTEAGHPGATHRPAGLRSHQDPETGE